MPTLRFESVVAAPIERVWAAFQDVHTLLPALTPPAQGLVIESADPLPPRPGTLVRMSVNGPFGRQAWTARYAAHVPPYATVTGVEARFVDEQTEGPFKRFVQSHEFEAAGDDATRCIDVVDYTPPWGPLGVVGDWLVLRRVIRRMFAHRHRRQIEIFGGVSVPSPGTAGRGLG